MALTNAVGGEKAGKLASSLGAFNPNWDFMVDALVGFNLEAVSLNKALGATVYSAHAGRRREATFTQMLDNARRCADLFECPVAVEGMYPRRAPGSDEFLVSTWEEKRQLDYCELLERYGSGLSAACQTLLTLRKCAVPPVRDYQALADAVNALKADPREKQLSPGAVPATIWRCEQRFLHILLDNIDDLLD